MFTGVNQSSIINLTNIATVSAAAFARYTLSHTYLKQLVPGQAKAGFNSQMVSLTQLYTYGDAKAKGITNITFNYTQSKFGTAENPVKNNTYQGGLQQSIVLPKGFAPMLGAGVTATQTNLNLLSLMYWVEAGSRVTIKEKAFLNLNFKYLRDNLGNSNYYTTLNLTATLYKGLQFKVSEQLQAIDAGRWFINSQAMAGISYNFAYTLKKPLSFRFKKQAKTVGK